jgi:C1A family cysteine protease
MSYAKYSQIHGNPKIHRATVNNHLTNKTKQLFPHPHGQPLVSSLNYSSAPSTVVDSHSPAITTLAHSPARQSLPINHASVIKHENLVSTDISMFNLYKTHLDFIKHVPILKLDTPHYEKLPLEFDWRHYAALAPCRNQGTCTNNFALSVMSALEDHMAVAHRFQPIHFSPCTNCNPDGNAALLLLELESKPNCVCYKNVKPRLEKASVGILTRVDDIKRHIMQYGSVISGMLVYSNFISGDFGSHGVYLDRVVSHHPVTSFGTPSGLVGTIAVVIIGWGVAENVQTSPGTYESVEYWICRNTWGPHWGKDKGYFRIATHRHNKVVQLEQVFFNRGKQCGGVVAFQLKHFFHNNLYYYLISFILITLILALVFKLRLKNKSPR